VFCVLINQYSTGLFVSYSSKKPIAQNFFELSLIVQGSAENELSQFVMELKFIYTKKHFFSMSKNVFLNRAEKVKPLTISVITTFKKMFCLPFQMCPHKLFVLHKEVVSFIQRQNALKVWKKLVCEETVPRSQGN
jgi:hypothetical protein